MPEPISKNYGSDDCERHVSISEAATMLNQSIVQTRRWFDEGKLEGFRHPINNYRRIYLRSVQDVRKATKAGGKVPVKKKVCVS